jgi:hypothetical protein
MLRQGVLDRRPEPGILIKVEHRRGTICDGPLDRPGVLFDNQAADHHGNNLLLFFDLPVYVLLDIRMVGIQGHHARRPPGRTPTLDR